MSSLHPSTFRVLLVLATALYLFIPAASRWLGLDEGLVWIITFSPGLLFVPVVLFSIRPNTFRIGAPVARALLFAGLVCGSSYLVIGIAITGVSHGPEEIVWPLAGFTGALLTLVLMRLFLDYRTNTFFWGWFIPLLLALLSQIVAIALLDFGLPKSSGGLNLNMFTILWWWFVGEALLFQQMHGPLLSNQPLHPDASRASALSAGERRR